MSAKRKNEKKSRVESGEREICNFSSLSSLNENAKNVENGERSA